MHGKIGYINTYIIQHIDTYNIIGDLQFFFLNSDFCFLCFVAFKIGTTASNINVLLQLAKWGYKLQVHARMIIINLIYSFFMCHRVFVLQVYSERYVDQMGIIGYFPANVVNETHIFVPDTIKSLTTVSAFASLTPKI